MGEDDRLFNRFSLPSKDCKYLDDKLDDETDVDSDLVSIFRCKSIEDFFLKEKKDFRFALISSDFMLNDPERNMILYRYDSIVCNKKCGCNPL